MAQLQSAECVHWHCPSRLPDSSSSARLASLLLSLLPSSAFSLLPSFFGRLAFSFLHTLRSFLLQLFFVLYDSVSRTLAHILIQTPFHCSCSIDSEPLEERYIGNHRNHCGCGDYPGRQDRCGRLPLDERSMLSTNCYFFIPSWPSYQQE